MKTGRSFRRFSEQNADCHVLIGGDINVDFPEIGWTLIDYTYSFNNLWFNIFDFLILSGVLFETAIESVEALHDSDGLSDHEPVKMKMYLDSEYVELSEKVHLELPSWNTS